ncbi:MAG: cyclic 2,3-diphosphoglycerate synthase [Candidatus Micrarchaeia archaeon]
MERKKVIIIGAAGRDFHIFNTLFRDDPNYEVVAFTASQIPFISDRKYPSELSGKQYPNGIQIYDESMLGELIRTMHADICIQAYSDLPYNEVMHKASIANANGADFWLVAPERSMLKSTKPVIAVCAVRTGSGKSQTSRYVAKIIKEAGKKPVVIRHPMPYGNLKEQIVERFATLKDLEKYKTTIEEREDYEPHLKNKTIVYAGVDYAKILEKAEQEADIIIWDGGNNDASFIKPDLLITVADPLRVGNELTYYPGETVARMANLLLINKANSATKQQIDELIENLKKLNSTAKIALGNSVIHAENGGSIKGKRVLVIEDGPTVTHGGMPYGAAYVAAKQYGAAEIVDPRKYAVGSIKAAYAKYTHLKEVLPAMGYSAKQIAELNATINNADCDVVLSATPTDLKHILNINKPLLHVSYELEEIGDEIKKAVLKIVNKG